jgi:hypothetical protein
MTQISRTGHHTGGMWRHGSLITTTTITGGRMRMGKRRITSTRTGTTTTRKINTMTTIWMLTARQTSSARVHHPARSIRQSRPSMTRSRQLVKPISAGTRIITASRGIGLGNGRLSSKKLENAVKPAARTYPSCLFRPRFNSNIYIHICAIYITFTVHMGLYLSTILIYSTICKPYI